MSNQKSYKLRNSSAKKESKLGRLSQQLQNNHLPKEKYVRLFTSSRTTRAQGAMELLKSIPNGVHSIIKEI